MSEDADTAPSVIAPVNKGPNDSSNYEPLKSVAIVALAGFAGSLCGVSLAKRRINPPPNLPTILAFSTATFAGIVEFSAIVSPTQLILQFLQDNVDFKLNVDVPSISDNTLFQWDEKCTATLGDYIIGGALAGAIFQGGQISPPAIKVVQEATDVSGGKKSLSQITLSGNEKQKKARGGGKVITLATKKNRAKASTMNVTAKESAKQTLKAVDVIPHAAKSRRGIMLGLIPGITLGLIAGLGQIGVAKASDYFEEMERAESTSVDDDDFVFTQEQEAEIEAKVKKMTLEEIQQEIDVLKAKLAQNKDNKK